MLDGNITALNEFICNPFGTLAVSPWETIKGFPLVIGPYYIGSLVFLWSYLMKSVYIFMVHGLKKWECILNGAFD